jgi:hypothetical protein
LPLLATARVAGPGRARAPSAHWSGVESRNGSVTLNPVAWTIVSNVRLLPSVKCTSSLEGCAMCGALLPRADSAVPVELVGDGVHV